METKHWFIGGGALLAIAVIIGGMVFFNGTAAMKKCETAGYGMPERAFSIKACPADEDYSHDSLAFVIGNTANNPKPTLTDETEKYLLNSLANTNGDLTAEMYSAVPGGIEIPIDTKKVRKASNVTSFIRNSYKKVDAINEGMQQAPTDNGADYFNNILAAGQALKTNDESEAPLLIVIGSGLSDSQPLNFAANDLLHANPKEVLAELKTGEYIVPGELSGIKIVWSGIGVVAPPQQSLDAKEIRNLTNIYSLIFESMGATFEADATTASADSIDTDYKVQPVKVNGLEDGISVTKLGEDTLGFEPDSAKIIDSEKAKAALAGLLGDAKRCANTKIKIEGYEAKLKGDQDEPTSKLSEDRANAVMKLFAEDGIDASRIDAAGRGNGKFENRVEELDALGEWNADKAKQNRVVIVSMSGACN